MFTILEGNIVRSGGLDGQNIQNYPSAIKGDILIEYDSSGRGGDWRRIENFYLNVAGVAAPATPAFSDGPFGFPSETSITVAFSAINTASWQVFRSGGGLPGAVVGSGNGSGADVVSTGLTANTTYTYAISIYSGLNQTGTEVVSFIDRTTTASSGTTTTTTTTTTVAPTTTTTTTSPG
jgi:hypothetical protein